MTPEEYKAQLQQAEEQYANERKRIHIAYAMANNPHKKGEIITDGIQTIRIEKIRTYMDGFGSLPMCIYDGPALKKDGAEKKDRKGNIIQASIYQVNMKENP